MSERVEQAQLGGYVTPVVTDHGDRLEVTWPEGRGVTTASPEVVEFWAQNVTVLRMGQAELRAERDRLRDVIAHAYVDLLAGRVDAALATLRVAPMPDSYEAGLDDAAAERDRLRAALTEVEDHLTLRDGTAWPGGHRQALQVAREALAQVAPSPGDDAGTGAKS